MKYSKLIKELEYLKKESGKEDPDVIISDTKTVSYVFNIQKVKPVDDYIGLLIHLR